MLQPVIGDHDVAIRVLGDKRAPGCDAVAPDPHRQPRSREKNRLVADFVGA